MVFTDWLSIIPSLRNEVWIATCWYCSTTFGSGTKGRLSLSPCSERRHHLSVQPRLDTRASFAPLFDDSPPRRPRNLCQALRQRQFAVLAVAQQGAVQGDQAGEEALQLAAAPAAELVGEVLAVAEEHAP